MLHRWLSPRVLVLVSVIFVLSAIAACGGSEAIPVPTATTAPVTKEISTPMQAAAKAAPAASGADVDYVPDWVSRGQYGGVLTMSVNRDLRHWDAHQGCCDPEGHWAGAIFDNLVEKDPVNTSEVICDLCLNWTTSADGLSMTFKMHPKAKWQDGKPVTAEDAKFSINRMTEKGKPRPRVGALRNYIESVEAPDQETLVINFQFPNPAAFMEFMSIGYTAIMPKQVLANSPDPDNFFDDPENLMASGPFKFEAWTKGDNAEVVKNDDYWKEGRPFVDGLQVFVMNDIGTIMAAFQTERILKCFKTVSCTVPQKDYLALVEAMGDKGVSFQGPTLPRSLNINHTREPFTDAKVRRAIYIGIDRKKAIDVAFLGQGLPGVPFPPKTFASSPQEEWAKWPGFRYVDASGKLVTDYMGRNDVVKDPADIELAKSLLTEAGFPNGFDTTIEAQKSFNEWMLVLQEDLAQIGVRAEIKLLDGATVIGNQRSGKYNLSVGAHGLSIYDPDEMLTCCYLPGGPKNPLLWENARIKEIFEAQKTVTDQATRGQMLREVEQILLQEIGSWFPIAWVRANGMVLNKKVKNYFPAQTNHQAQGHDHMWIEQ